VHKVKEPEGEVKHQ